MKTMFLVTGTNEVAKYADSLRALNLGDVNSLRYDEAGGSESMLLGRIKDFAPDLVVYIGQRWGTQPSISTLARINSGIAPSVHICSDAADPPWWDLLREYHNSGAFTLQVNIDGSRKWPTSDANLTLLTPVDPANFPADYVEHEKRGIACGWAGNPGSGPGSQRTALLESLLEKRLIDLRIRSNLPFTYESYCDYLTKCRMALNIAYSGTEVTKQVKGRVVEAALAGACLLETEGAPTSDWFRPGIDYLEYRDAEDVAQIITRLTNEPEATEAMAMSLRARIGAHHTPRHFWKNILERIGFKEADAC